MKPLTLALPLGLLACGPSEVDPPSAGPRSVLMITLDTARRDAFGFMGASPSPSPNLDRLAADARVFEQAYTTAPLTLPAHASLLTGLYPVSHGLRDNGVGALSESALTLAETLTRAGWRARAAVSAFVLDPCFGLDQGFESYKAPPREPNAVEINVVQLRAGEMLDRALTDLEVLVSAPEPFFYWLHLYDPHAPYDAPGAASGGEPGSTSRYEAEIRYADRELGRLFDFLRKQDLWEDMVVVFTSDHGEGLEHGHEKTHGFFVFDETMRIPLLIKHPELGSGRFQGAVSIIDVAPTLISLLGLAIDEDSYDGIDLSPSLRGEGVMDPERILLLESYQPYIGHGWAPFQAGVRGTRKYVRSSRRELFDRSEDPRELEDLWAAEPGLGRELSQAIDARFLELAGRLSAERRALGAEEQRALSDLGYVGSGEVLELAEALDFQALADPYAKYPLYERMLAVSQLIATGELEAATVELRLLAGLEPENPALLERLAEVLLYRGGDFLEEAERSYRRVLQMRPRRTQSLLGLANVALLRSEALRQRMLEELEAGRDASARTLAETWRPLARRSAEGFRRVLEEEPTHPTALHNLSTLLVSMSEDAYMRGQRAEAKRSLQEARRLLLRLMDALEETDARRVAYETQRRVLEQRLREL